MRSSRFITLMLALPMAFLLLSCDGGGSSNGPIFPQPPNTGDGVVSVQVPAGVSFYGFDIFLDYDAGAMTPRTPLATHVVSSGLGVGSNCAPNQTGTELRLGCAKSTPMNGPGEIATFGFSWTGTAPTAADFSVDCDFFNELGALTAGTCTGTWVN